MNPQQSSSPVGFISRRLFELQLRAFLDRMEGGLAQRIQRKAGYAWRPIVDRMYQGRVPQMTFANRNNVLTECASSLLRLDQSIEDR
jgi:hypothetical protein